MPSLAEATAGMVPLSLHSPAAGARLLPGLRLYWGRAARMSFITYKELRLDLIAHAEYSWCLRTQIRIAGFLIFLADCTVIRNDPRLRQVGSGYFVVPARSRK